MNLVRLETGCPQVWGGSPPTYGGYTGNGVIVGVVSTGIDVTHDDFKNADGTTRILYYWVQRTGTGDPRRPFAINPAFVYQSGQCWTATDINAGTVTADSNAKDKRGRGTHMAGCAAGNGRAFGPEWPQYSFVGMAPKADLVIVKLLNVDLVCKVDSQQYYEAVNFIYKVAAVTGKSAVVVTDEFGQYGSHTGGSCSEYDMSQAMVLNGSQGRILVLGVNDDGDAKRHAQTYLAILDAVNTVSFSVPAYTKDPTATVDQIQLEFYADYPIPPYNLGYEFVENTYDYQVRVVGPSGETTAWFGPNSTGETLTLNMAFEKVTIKGKVPGLEGCEPILWHGYHVKLERLDATKTIRAGTWQVQFKNMDEFPIKINGWLTYCHLGAGNEWGCSGVKPVFVLGESAYAQIGQSSTAHHALAVGAYSHRTTWINSLNANTIQNGAVRGDIASFSSRGPRLGPDLGVLTPDDLTVWSLRPYVAAPGFPVASSKSSQITPLPADDAERTLQDLKHWMLSGTAIAASIVAGGIALFLEQHPTYTTEDMMPLIVARRRRDIYTEPTPNHKWGVGKFAVTDPTQPPGGGSVQPPHGIGRDPGFELPP